MKDIKNIIKIGTNIKNKSDNKMYRVVESKYNYSNKSFHDVKYCLYDYDKQEYSNYYLYHSDLIDNYEIMH